MCTGECQTAGVGGGGAKAGGKAVFVCICVCVLGGQKIQMLCDDFLWLTTQRVFLCLVQNLTFVYKQ